MKRISVVSRSRRVTGFTLVELLVVIAIIAILAGTTLSIAGSVIKQAKKAKANNTATQIQTACLSYYTEYSVYPVPTGSTGLTSFIGDTGNAANGTAWQNLTCALCGNLHPSDGTSFTPSSSGPSNTRAIAFLNFNAADVMTAKDVTANANATRDAPKNPLPTSSTVNLYFNIVMDADYAGVIGVSPSTFTSLPNFAAVTSSTTSVAATGGTCTAGIAVWANCNASTTLTAPSGWVHTY